MAVVQSEFAAGPSGDRSKTRQRPAGAAKRASRRRLALGVAAVLALAVLGAIGGKPASPTPESATGYDPVATGIDTEAAARFDGRGKWTGYAR